MVLWTLAGVLYPSALHSLGANVSGQDYVHFFVSLLLGGMLGISYPFFGLVAIGIRAWYPRFVEVGTADQEDLDCLTRLHRQTWFYLGAAQVPILLGIARPVRASLAVTDGVHLQQPPS